MGVPIAVVAPVLKTAVGKIGSHFARKSNPGVYTLGNRKYLGMVEKGEAPLTDAFLLNRAGGSTVDARQFAKILQKQPGAEGPLPATSDVLSSTPTMPGGAWATPDGVIGATSSRPPLWFGAPVPGGSGTRRKRRRSSSKRKAKGSSSKRKAKGRKLKFGSPAWRKKYLKKRKR